MSNSSGPRTIEVDEKQTGAAGDHEPPNSQSKQENGKHPTTRRKRVLLISGALVLVIAAGYFLWNAFRFENTDDAEVDGHVMPLSARISGQIKDVFVIERQVVHAGDVLVTIDPQDYQVTADQPQANLADDFAKCSSSHWTLPITYVTVRTNR